VAGKEAKGAIMKLFFKVCLAASMALGWSVALPAGRIGDNGTALYSSSRSWFPLINDTSGNVFHIDPMSITKIDPDNWEINTTSINQKNEYDPYNTVTLRINCLNLTIQTQGWRIGVAFIENKTAIGLKAANSTRRKVKSGTIDKFIYDFVCGVSDSGDIYYGLATSKMLDNSSFGYVLIKNNKFFINKNNKHIRKFSAGIGHDFFVDCNKSNLLEVTQSAPPYFTENASLDTTVGGVIVAKICRQSPSYLQFEETDFTVPAFSNSQNDGPENSSGLTSGASIDDAKKKCAELGFTRGTEKFGNCVLKVSR
jgi:hypothetical protein